MQRLLRLLYPVRDDRPQPSLRDRVVSWVILNVGFWAWLLAGMDKASLAAQASIWGGTAVALFLWDRIVRRRLTRQHRLAHALCVNCGYDLRESPAACPECNTPAPPQHRTLSARAADLERVR